ncbi:GNAT family N-acetyltransferase [Enterococcus timonensis]|uniref:GNAT family N-acetyltransferase n=1 Tax=Enterococcus timonensis TaxID=1852364 RepID=UPI0008DB1BFD|nr:GNAT family N-acetyltransferase [Enterococcus timonensis]
MIRNAQKKDLPEIAQLILVILKDMELPFLDQVPEDEVLEILQEAALEPEYRYSLTRGVVYEENGQVAGVAFGYPDTDEEVIDRPLNKILLNYGISQVTLFEDPETFPDEWYLDSISVAKNFRGQGIGTKLLNALPEIAHKEHRQKIGLACDLHNPNAKRLYEKMGFTSVGQYKIAGHMYDHMQKKI